MTSTLWNNKEVATFLNVKESTIRIGCTSDTSRTSSSGGRPVPRVRHRRVGEPLCRRLPDHSIGVRQANIARKEVSLRFLRCTGKKEQGSK